MRIAVIGTGISGLGAAWLLRRRHEVHVFEARDRLGGHAYTVEVSEGGRRLGLDTGFLVFNEDNYPNLTRLFEHLGVESRETDMSFAVRCERCDLEYSGLSAYSLFAQLRNLWRPSHYRMLADVARFGTVGQHALATRAVQGRTLGQFLSATAFGQAFARHYLIPMAAALWSTGTGRVEEFPVESLLRFFDTHGLLRVRDRLKWRTVVGGSRRYVDAITRDFAGRIHRGTAVRGVARTGGGVRLYFDGDNLESFDRVVIATHADQALALLRDPSREEVDLLSPWRYSRNDTWLHSDRTHLPRRRAAWGSWNYMLPDCRRPGSSVSVSYYLNGLQGLNSDRDYVVTLNPSRSPAAETVIRRMTYRHPIFTAESVATQDELPTLNGSRDTFFCGAYFRYGFHEDGLRSAVQVAEAFGISMP
ncbi:MAG: NAD(P)-binding protein [Gemmatimonadetes bacterium]|uniref:NAD(P)-binding protein n=1 Tax=Candidatus Kutchimonas denitrificans TaxID=3056748 RepID=A0AAE4Z942_9BACT|nr:NAD(P)-binding protein [Gemmatimonadota bacterium]NIR74436.1 NAD(P)-binding protein [Candidatus Kutchimonas denitrificans]NIS00832.1 NAD(P)-binding protein [Gemmatimonadota bacterium]NIT66455.1 NAD(P)-binding protein [Gemmatimonadota bacterium]NIU52086.1 NAD(P)-binding protein [Gemmatimonadota bacterium]